MPNKILVIEPDRCTGCALCEIVCSLRQVGVSNPQRSRIRVVGPNAGQGRFLPVTCQQCQEAPCAAVCPREAISRDPALLRMTIDYERCISCRMCVAACPYGAMRFEADKGRVFKCDLCDGRPECVRWCEADALRYVDPVDQGLTRSRRAALRLAGTRRS